MSPSTTTLIRKIVGGLAVAIGATLTSLTATGVLKLDPATLAIIVQVLGTVSGWVMPQPGKPAEKAIAQ